MRFSLDLYIFLLLWVYYECIYSGTKSTLLSEFYKPKIEKNQTTTERNK